MADNPRIATNFELWQVDQLIPYARNPRTHTDEQVAQLAASIMEFGFANPLLVGSDGVVIAGHARLQAARKLGLSEVPVIVLDHLSEAQRRALVIADNQLAIAGTGWDEELLRGLLVDLRQDEFNLDLLGFSDEEIAGWLAQEPGAPQEGLTEEDAVPEPLEEPVTRRGDLWILGNHRLLCGDSASSEDVQRLVEGALVDLVNTDPPYNVRVEPRSNNAIAAGLSSFANLSNDPKLAHRDRGGESIKREIAHRKGLQHHQGFDLHRGASKAKATTKKMRPKDRALANDFMKDADYDVLLRQWFGNIAAALKPGGAFYLFPSVAPTGLDDETFAYRLLQEEFGVTQEQIAARLRKSQATIANTLRLLQLPEEVQQSLDKGRITEGHARALLALPTPQAMKEACLEVERRNLSVRQTEQMVRRWNISRGIRSRPRRAVDPNIAAVEAEISASLQTKVAIRAGRRRGHIVIEYYSPADLDRIVSMLLAVAKGAVVAGRTPGDID